MSDLNPQIASLKEKIFSFNLPDPERAWSNIISFLEANPDRFEEVEANLYKISLLFSCSQFLANHCINNSNSVFQALGSINQPLDEDALRHELIERLSKCLSTEEGMKAIRDFRKNIQLTITFKDLLKKASLQDIMAEMSSLADVILSESLVFVEKRLQQRYGIAENNSITIISLGKLGAQELNYSSDVDFIAVYRDEGETTGVSNIQGVTMNRTTAFQYYSKLIEDYCRFLSANTEDGFAYRVDLRLRPQGQRGSLALSLRGHEEYYESWGQLWERAAMLRARPVAGDMRLGEEFINLLKPFVYRKYLDFEAIEEIRKMKSQVEHLKPGTLSRDIKRGFGGIREIEFFIQIFQLIYGGKEFRLRERSTFKALHILMQKGLIGYDDAYRLSENYSYFRTLEHRLQQLNDIQTHSLPSGAHELTILSKKMGFNTSEEFTADLDKRRQIVREIYNSLLESGKHESSEHETISRIFWDTETPIENLLEGHLFAVKDVRKVIHCLAKIRNNIYSFQTIRGRRLLEEIIPRFVDAAIKGDNADSALLHLVDFSAILAAKEFYLEAIAKHPEIIPSVNFIFSHSEYLSKMVMGSPEYLETLVSGERIKKSRLRLLSELDMLVKRYGEIAAVRLIRRLEELRLGTMFLNKVIDIAALMRSITKTAEAVLVALKEKCPSLTIIAFGKMGAREMTFNSDLDIIFLTQNAPLAEDSKEAQRILKALMSYTKDGLAYRVDTRLRPDGSKGQLVTSLQGIREYYLKSAHTWELQALLKARPVCVKRQASSVKRFMELRKEVLMKRGAEITVSDIKKMRSRIQRELSKETAGTYDIKLGSGGLEEIEFSIQYLQLKNCAKRPELLVQGTLNAVKRMGNSGILGDEDAIILNDIYIFYRYIETILRLRNESLLKEGSDTMRSVSRFMNMSEKELIKSLNEKRQWVNSFWNKLI
jgi:glutamate-ammonia-ligase adenylyltransferase